MSYRIVNCSQPEDGDIVIEKTTYAGFHGTKLDKTLKSLGIDRIRLTGCVTHICILFSAYEAVVLDYNVSVLSDAVAGLSREDHDAALRIMKNVLGVTVL